LGGDGWNNQFVHWMTRKYVPKVHRISAWGKKGKRKAGQRKDTDLKEFERRTAECRQFEKTAGQMGEKKTGGLEGKSRTFPK